MIDMVQKSDTETKLKFLSELDELCATYNLIISSCGCCGSPWICGVGSMFPNVSDYIAHLRKEAKLDEPLVNRNS